MPMLDDFKDKKQLNISDNKQVKINKIRGININYFRKFENQELPLGDNVTIIFGRNGTLKSTLMGLIAQPFRTDRKNLFGATMQTKFSDVFKLSKKYDNQKYNYDLLMDVNDNQKLKSNIDMYPQTAKTGEINAFRVVPDGRNAGDGYYWLPSVYTKLNRVYPLVDTEITSHDQKIEYSDRERKQIGEFYNKVILRDTFNESVPFGAKYGSSTKHSFGPENSYYDMETISSGEDNLGTFINVMISFQRIHESKSDDEKKYLTGIWSIDEFEVGLHPIAQMNLLDYLIKWSKHVKVQIILNTHSLYLIQQALLRTHDIGEGSLVINCISSLYKADNSLTIIKNPEYKKAYTELTLKTLNDDVSKYIDAKVRVIIFCEDGISEKIINEVLSLTKETKELKKIVEYKSSVNSSEQEGTQFWLLNKLVKEIPDILDEVNGIVVIDGDHKESVKEYKKSKGKFERYYSIPTINENLPFEKDVANWIYKLDGDDKFFKELGFPKEMFKQSLSEKNIVIGTTSNTRTYKNWFNSYSKIDQNKIIHRYVKYNDTIFSEFRDNIVSDIKKLLSDNGIVL